MIKILCLLNISFFALASELCYGKAPGISYATPYVFTTGIAISPSYNAGVYNSAIANIEVLPDVNLKSLALSSGTLTPVFAAGITSYTTTVNTATITVTPATSDPDATVKVNGITVVSGTASAALPLVIGSNVITTVVTASDGTTTKTYTVTVTRLSNNALLSSLKVNPATTLTVVSGPNFRNYTTTVLNSESTVKITATTLDATATIKINGVTVASGAASGSIPLNVGTTVINTVVTAQDGITTKTYSITFTRPPSTNANLAHLTLSSGTLTPVFAAGTTSYTATVGTATITVTPTTCDPDATVKVNGTTVASGTASAALPLVVGSNVITTVVTASDGTTTKTYTTTVTRLSDNALLTSIKANPATNLTVVSGPDFRDYTTNVPNSESTVKITATVQDATATIKINGVTVASGVASASIPLIVGDNVINTVVTAQDGTTIKTYSIKFTRLPSTNANLADLALTDIPLTTMFSAGTTSYKAWVYNATTSITVTPTTADANATVKINGVTTASGVASAAIPLITGDNVINTVVTAQDGVTTKTYTITVTRISNNAFLTEIQVSPVTTLTAVSGPSFRNYITTVPYSESSVRITATALDAAVNIKINGVTTASDVASAAIPLIVGDNVVNIVVTAPDSITTKTYSIKFTRLSASNANLANLTLNGGALTPVFAAGTTSYTATVSYPGVTLTPTAVDASEIIKVNGATVASGAASAFLPLVIGPNVINTVVTAPDGVTTKTYTITVTFTGSTDALLTKISVTPATTLAVLSGPNFRNYATTVPNSESSVKITGKLEDASATMKINGVTTASGAASAAIPLSVGDNVINTVVTAQDGITIKIYSIKFTRQPPSGAALSLLYTEKASSVSDSSLTVQQNVSPNGDGISDMLIIDGITVYPDNKVQIMNRNGVLVYEAKGYDNQVKVFDGHSSIDGRLQQSGTYFYSLEYKNGKETKHKTGFVVLKY